MYIVGLPKKELYQQKGRFLCTRPDMLEISLFVCGHGIFLGGVWRNKKQPCLRIKAASDLQRPRPPSLAWRKIFSQSAALPNKPCSNC
jgi:hypothetical protein